MSTVGPIGNPGKHNSSVDIGGVSDFVRGLQDSRADQNRRALKSTEHAVLAGMAWAAWHRAISNRKPK